MARTSRFRLVRWAARGLLAVLVLAVVIVLLLETPWAHERARRLIESRINSALNGELRIGKLSGSFWGHVTLADISVTQAGVPVISSRSISARYRPWRVFTEGAIDEVVLTGLGLDLIETESGWNIVGLADPSDEPRRGPSISIRRLEIVDGTLHVRPLEAPSHHLADLNLAGALDYQPQRMELTVDRTTTRDPNTGVAVRELSGSMRFEPGTIDIDDLRLATAGSRIEGKIELKRSASGPQVEVVLDAHPLAVSELAHYAPALAPVTVVPTVQLKASGPQEQFAVTFAVQAAEGAVSGHGSAGLEDGVVRFNGDVEAAKLNLAPWLGRPNLAGRITGRATVDLTVPPAGFDRAVLRFTARADEAAVAGYHASAVSGSGTYKDGALNFTGRAAAYGASARMTGTWARDELTARGDVERLDLTRLPRHLNAPAMATNVAAAFDVALGRSAWRVDATLGASTILDAEVTPGTTAHVSSERGALSYAASGTATNVDVERFRRALRAPPSLDKLTGNVNAQFAVTGRGTDLSATAAHLQLRLTDSTLAGVRIAALDATATLAARRLVVDADGSVRQVSNQTVGVASQFAADGAAAVHLDVADILAPNWTLRTTGTVTATLENITVLDTPLDRVQVEGSLEPGVATIKTLALESAHLKATAAGTFAFDDEHESDLTYEITASDLSRLPRFGTQALSGSAHAVGRLTGPPSRLSTAGDVQGYQLTFGTLQVLALKGRLEGSVPVRDVKSSHATFTGESTFIAIGGTNVDRVQATVTYDAGTIDADAVVSQRARVLRFAGALVPHPQHREVHIRSLSAQAGDATWTMPAGQEALVQYAPDRLMVRDLEFVRDTARIAVSGTVDATGAAPEPLTITAERVRIEDINKALLGTHDLQGQLDGTARVAGTMSALRISAEGSVASGKIDGTSFDRLAGRFDYAAERLGLDVHLQAGAAGELKAAGSMPIKFGPTAGASAPPFDLAVQSPRIDLTLLKPLSSHVQIASGTGRIDLKITGPASAPAIAGDLGVADATLIVGPTGVTYHRANAAMTFEGDRLTIKEFRVEDDDGHVATIVGGLNVAVTGPPSAFDLYMSAADFHVLKNSLGEMSVNADLHALGDLKTPLLVGTIEIDRGRLEVDDLLERFAAGGYRAAAADVPADAPGESAPSAWTQSSFSVTLALPDNVVVRGRDLRAASGSFGLGDINATLGGALTVSKESGEPPKIVGRLDVVRGQYTFQGRRFTINRGSELIFRGDDLLNPALNVTAERQIGGVTAQVRVAGNARTPEVVLSSTPPLDQGDVLSLIVFNQTMNELTTANRVSLAGRAGTLAARALATPLADSVMRALDLDLFEIQPNEDVGTGAVLAVGRQVNDHLFVGFKQTFGADDVSQVSFEYRINEFLRLVTSFAEGADRSRSIPRAETAGIDLFFVIRK